MLRNAHEYICPQPAENETSMSSDDDELSPLEKFKKASERVRNKVWTPPVYFLTFEFNERLYAFDTTLDHSLVAFSFEDSAKIFINRNTERRVSEIYNKVLLHHYNTIKVAKTEYDKIADRYTPEKYLLGHSQPVSGLKFVSPKDLLLSCSFDGTVKAWNTKKLIEVQQYAGHKDFYSDIDVSRNSQYFATGGIKGSVSLFSFERKIPEQIFSGHAEDVNCLRFHPNGIYFATCSEDKTVKLWSIQSGKLARTFQDDKCTKTLAFSPDGNYLASYSGGKIKMWDLASGQLLTTFVDSSEDSTYAHLCFCEFGGLLASGGTQKEFKFWDVNNLSSISQEVPGERCLETESRLVESYPIPYDIKYIKFDENNLFTAVGVK